MPYLIGTDEAGYGPNLGPLVISASVWWVAEPTTDYDLYKRLRAVVCKSTPRGGPARRLAIADSKALYSPALGLGALERGVLAALGLIDRCPGDWLDVWQMLDAASIAHLPTMPWHLNYDLRLPLAADLDDLARLVPKLRRGFETAGVRLVALESRAVFPERFNRSAAQFGNKSEALSKITLALVGDVLERCASEPVAIVCDKHGGRNYYGRLLQEQFPDPLVEVYCESNAQSIYRWGAPEERIEVCFRSGGEAFMPAALASMASKYLRELSMRAFNDFWCGRVRDLSPTAGYPLDARRFKAAIREEQSALGIDDRILWRNR
jgi:hypothetical protein